MKRLICYIASILTLISSSVNVFAQDKLELKAQAIRNLTESATALETAISVPANDFLNSIGANSAIYRRGENLESTMACCRYLGIRWIRMDEAGRANDIKRLYEEAGVKVSCSLGSGGSDITGVVNGAKAIAAFGGLLAIEGANEPNNWGITYQGEKGGRLWNYNTNNWSYYSWLPIAKLHRDLYTAVKSDPVLKDYPVWSTTETGAQSDNCGLQFLTILEGQGVLMPDGTKYADYATCHNYFIHPSFPPVQNNQTWRASEPLSSCPVDGLYGNFGKTWSKKFPGYSDAELIALPKVTTETGVTIGGDVTEEMQALMYMSMYLAQYKRGWSYTSMYLLRDRSDESGNQTFGFYKPDYSARQSALYLHNLTTILADDNSIESPGELTYALSPGRPSTVHELLLQKSNGTLELVVWSERFIGGSDEIEVQFDQSFDEVKVYDPTVGTEAIQTLNNVSSVSLTMTSHPFILEIKSNATSNKDIKVNEPLGDAVLNPVGDVLYLENTKGLEKIEIFDLTGKNVLSFLPENDGRMPLHVAHLAKGTYMLRLTATGNKVERCKIIKN